MKSDNNLLVFGLNKQYSLGVEEPSATKPIPLQQPTLLDALPPIIDVTCGEQFCYFRCVNDEIYFIGENGGYLDEASTVIEEPYKITFFEENHLTVKEIHVGRGHASFLCTNDEIYMCGKSEYYQLGIRKEEKQSWYSKVEPSHYNHEKIITVPCGVYNTLIHTETQKESHLWIFGCDYFSCFGMGDKVILVPTQVLGTQRIIQIAHGFCFFLALTNHGNVCICGLSKFVPC
jgi:alpha-tubulin suppressor-like RCC1 family protein